MTEAVLRDQLANALGSQGIDLTQVVADPEALQLVPEEFARRHHLLPIAHDAARNVLTLATTDMFNVVALDQLKAALGGQLEIDTLLAAEAQLLECIDKFYGFDLSLDGILREIETGEVDYASLNPETEEYTQPVVRLVGALLTDAVKRDSSDIHFEPEHAFLRIRYRIDGVLEQIRSLHKTYWPGILVRLKVLSGMNIAETRAPQDGRMSLTLNGRPIDFRVSSQPGIHGENLVLRILDREKSIMPLEQMGFTDRRPARTATDDGAARRHPGRHRADRLRQDHHAVLDAVASQQRDRQHHDAGRPGRIPGHADAPELGQRNAEARLRQRHPLDHAAGSGHHPGRRDPRQGHRRDGLPRRHDRPPGVHHPAHQLRARRVPAPDGHRHPARHPVRQHHRRHRAAAGAQAVSALQGSLHAGRT